MGFKAIYGDQWDKAAKNCECVILDLTAKFAKDGLILRAGHGALSADPQSEEHDHGEPDIFLVYQDNIIGGVEVTGSSKVNWPCEAWVGKHKLEYALNAYFPVAFVLFYPNAIRFVTAKSVENYAPQAEQRTLYGGIEYYHVLLPHHTHGYQALTTFVEGLIDFAKRDEFQKEISLDEHKGVPWE